MKTFRKILLLTVALFTAVIVETAANETIYYYIPKFKVKTDRSYSEIPLDSLQEVVIRDEWDMGYVFGREPERFKGMTLRAFTIWSRLLTGNPDLEVVVFQLTPDLVSEDPIEPWTALQVYDKEGNQIKDVSPSLEGFVYLPSGSDDDDGELDAEEEESKMIEAREKYRAEKYYSEYPFEQYPQYADCDMKTLLDGKKALVNLMAGRGIGDDLELMIYLNAFIPTSDGTYKRYILGYSFRKKLIYNNIAEFNTKVKDELDKGSYYLVDSDGYLGGANFFDCFKWDLWDCYSRFEKDFRFKDGDMPGSITELFTQRKWQ